MALYPPLPPIRPFPSGRYTRTNPLRRESGLRLLAAPLPEPLRTSLIRAWRHPRRFDGNQAIQSAGARGAAENAATVVPASRFPPAPAAAGVYRQRPDEAALRSSPPAVLDWLAFMELETSRRVVETPRQSISRETRNKLLASQGVYLAALYNALAAQIGAAAAQAAFERSLHRAV